MPTARPILLLLASAALAAAGCVGEVGKDEDTGPVDTGLDVAPIEVSCADAPAGAVGAWYEHFVTATGGEGYLWFVADGLPPGVKLAYGTGRLSGWPEEAGSYDVRLRVGDSRGTRVEIQCPIEVRPTLAVDLAPLFERPAWCLDPAEPLTDLLVPGTGDDAPVRCSFAGGYADGKLPAGLTVNAETCAVEGTIDESVYGTWAFVVTAEQSGASVHVPYCAPQPDNAGEYELVVKHSGLTDAALVPWSETFPTGDTLNVEVGGDGATPFSATDARHCTSDCYYSGWWWVDRSPVPIEDLGMDGLSALDDNRGTTVGLSHGFGIDRAYLRDDLYARPIVVQVSLLYCVSPTAADCATFDSSASTGERFEFAMVLVPEASAPGAEDTGG